LSIESKENINILPFLTKMKLGPYVRRRCTIYFHRITQLAGVTNVVETRGRGSTHEKNEKPQILFWGNFLDKELMGAFAGRCE